MDLIVHHSYILIDPLMNQKAVGILDVLIFDQTFVVGADGHGIQRTFTCLSSSLH